MFTQKNIVDLGCGTGFICDYAVNQGGARQALGIDIIAPPNYRDDCKWIYKNFNLEKQGWSKNSVEVLGGEKADLILAFDILEHLTSPWEFLEECNNLLNQSGKLVLTTPNVNSWERFLKPDDWSGSLDPQHKILFTKYSLQFALEKQGFSVETIKAPVRKLQALSSILPDIGGQLFTLNTKKVDSESRQS